MDITEFIFGAAKKSKNPKKWQQDATNPKTKGDLHRALGVPLSHKFTIAELEKEKEKLHKIAEKGPLTRSELHLLRMIIRAINGMRSRH